MVSGEASLQTTVLDLNIYRDKSIKMNCMNTHYTALISTFVVLWPVGPPCWILRIVHGIIMYPFSA